MLTSLKKKLGRSTPTAGSASPVGAVASPAAVTPSSDVALPKRERRRSSIIREEKVAALKDLPQLKDTPITKREQLFKQKLELCCVIFNFDSVSSDKRGKELKRVTLLELVDYVNSAGGQKIFTDTVIPDIIKMISGNIFRALPPQNEEFDPDEDEPALEPSWPHLQVVYEFFLRFVVSAEVKAKSAKKFIDQSFCSKLIDLFDTEDPREREYLKTILHRIYGKFMSLRSFIRKAIGNVFFKFVYETERHNGIGELLEILGSIINGFALPLKQEHLEFLDKALMPLHRPKGLAAYHQQLAYCVMQYIEKDPQTAAAVVLGLIKSWPWTVSAKQVVFLNELEEILELMGPELIDTIIDQLFRTISKCVGSSHFQVAERALFLWNNDHLLNHGCLSKAHAPKVLPMVFNAIYKHAQTHWNPTVHTLAEGVLKHYSDRDPDLYEKCLAAYPKDEERGLSLKEQRKRQWEALEKMVA